MQTKHPILDKEIELLATSNEFLLMAKQNGFKNLGEMAKHSLSALKQMPGMNYRMLAELGEILKGYDLMGIINED